MHSICSLQQAIQCLSFVSTGLQKTKCANCLLIGPIPPVDSKDGYFHQRSCLPFAAIDVSSRVSRVQPCELCRADGAESCCVSVPLAPDGAEPAVRVVSIRFHLHRSRWYWPLAAEGELTAGDRAFVKLLLSNYWTRALEINVK